MKKQFTLNLDAIVAISIIFIMLIGFIGFQRYQYSDLLEEHVQLQWNIQDLEINIKLFKAQLDQYNQAN